MKSLLPFLLLLATPIYATQALPNLQHSYSQLLCNKFSMQHQEDIISHLPIEEQNGDICVMELYSRFYPVTAKTIQDLIQSLKPDGTWPDIDYVSKNMSGWPPATHQMRLLDMVKYHRTMPEEATSPFTKNELEESIHQVISAWFAKNPISRNWWQNCIGTPKLLGPAFILFRDYMSPKELEQSRALLQREFKLSFTLTGQNRVWICEAKLLSALFSNDHDTLRQMRDEFLKELVVGEHEGIQKDGSFHQHGAQQQMGNYGLAFLMLMSFYSNLFADTDLAFPENKQDVINQLYLQGYQWMRWGDILDLNAMGRQISRNVMRQKGASTFLAGCMLQKNSSETAQAELAASLPATALIGQKHFEESELTIHRTPRWMASLRMSSSRLIGVEKCNGDGRTASFMGDGALYLYKSQEGYEYENIQPLWNPRRIPGITCMASDASAKDLVARNDTSFVGGVTDGHSGISAMELNRYGVKAFKSWVMTDEWILCLGSDIHADKAGLLTTSMAERISRDELYCLQDDRWQPVSSKLKVESVDELRFHHDGIAYIALSPRCLCALNREVSGDWHEVSDFYPDKSMHSDQLLSLYLEHRAPEQGYHYFILPDATKERAAQFDTSKVKILYQDANIHAVEADGVYYIALRQVGDYSFPFSESISLEKVGIYLIKKQGDDWCLLRAEYP